MVAEPKATPRVEVVLVGILKQGSQYRGAPRSPRVRGVAKPRMDESYSYDLRIAAIGLQQSLKDSKAQDMYTESMTGRRFRHSLA